MLPVKLKTETWTTYAHDFERVEQLRPLNARASSSKKNKQKKPVRQKVGLQDWHMGDAVTSEVVKLKSRPSLSLSQATHVQHLAKQARKAADEQLQKSLAHGATHEQIRRSMEKDDSDAAMIGSTSSIDVIGKGQRVVALETEAEKLVSGIDANDALLVELAGEEILDTGMVGTLAVRVVAVICSAERGSSAWLRFMSRLTGITETQHELSMTATFAPAVAPRPMPVCHITLWTGTGPDDDAMAVGTHTKVATAGACRATSRHTQSGDLRAPEDDDTTTARSSLMLCWQTEEQFELSSFVLTGSTERAVGICIEDIGAAELDLSKSPDPSMKWRLKQWVELADEDGKHAASAHVQVRWSPAGRPLLAERREPLAQRQHQEEQQ